MKKTSLWSLLCLIWASTFLLSSSFKLRPNSAIRSSGCSSATAKFRSAHIPHLLPQIHEDRRTDVILQSAPLEKINEADANSTSPLNLKIIIPVVVILAAAAAAVGSGQFGTFDFTQIIEQSASKIEKMGPYGYLYFALVRVIDFNICTGTNDLCLRRTIGMNHSSSIFTYTNMFRSL
jgi:hypothetical protein